MGSQLVMSAYTYWSELPHGAFRLLVRMAITARDADPEPKAWIGRDELARSMGLAPTPGNFRNVRRWLAQLEKAGAIERTEVGRFGRRTTYLIHPRPRAESVDNPVDKILRRAVQAGRFDPPVAGRFDPPVAGRFDPPEEPLKEPIEEYGKENHVASTYSR